MCLSNSDLHTLDSLNCVSREEARIIQQQWEGKCTGESGMRWDELMRNRGAQNLGNNYIQGKEETDSKVMQKSSQHYLQWTQGWVIRETVQVPVLRDWVGGVNCWLQAIQEKKKVRGEGVGWRWWISIWCIDRLSLSCRQGQVSGKVKNQTQNSHEGAAPDTQKLFGFYIKNVWFKMYVQCSVVRF